MSTQVQNPDKTLLSSLKKLPLSEYNGKETMSSSEEEVENGVIRCPCQNNIDHGMMIQCDSCGVWQHSTCVGIREEKDIPANYYCEECKPRNFNCPCGENKPKGKQIQCSQCSTWQHAQCVNKNIKILPKHYKCPKCNPEGLTKGKAGRKRKGCKTFNFANSPTLKELFENYSLKVKELGQSSDLLFERCCLKACDIDETFDLEEEFLKGLSNLFEWSLDTVKQNFESVLTNILNPPSLQEITTPDSNWTAITCNIYQDPSLNAVERSEDENSFISVNFEVKQVSKANWGLVLQDKVESNQKLFEYIGEVSSYDIDSLTEIQSFTLYRKDVLINAKQNGNKARFIRRSCKPNAQIEEVVYNNRLHCNIVASEDIPSNTEVTIGFDYPWESFKREVICACNSPSCLINEYYEKRRSNADKLMNAAKKSIISSPNESSEEKKKNVTSPSQPKKKKVPGMLKNLDTSPFNELTLNEKSMNREERKIAMVMKSFQKLERMNKKRKSAKDPKDPKEPKESSNTKRIKSIKKRKKSNSDDYQSNSSLDEEDSPRNESPHLESPRLESPPKLKIEIPTQEKTASFEKSPQIERSNSVSTPPTSTKTSYKYGKKAWIQEFQQEQSQKENNSSSNGSNSDSPSVSSNGNEYYKFPVKKKMLDTYLSQESQNGNKDETKEEERTITNNETKSDPVNNSTKKENPQPLETISSVNSNSSVNGSNSISPYPNAPWNGMNSLQQTYSYNPYVGQPPMAYSYLTPPLYQQDFNHATFSHLEHYKKRKIRSDLEISATTQPILNGTEIPPQNTQTLNNTDDTEMEIDDDEVKKDTILYVKQEANTKSS